MADIDIVLPSAAAMTAFWTVIGFPAARRAIPSTLYWLYAPALGWAVHSVLTLILFSVFGMSREIVFASSATVALIALLLVWRVRPAGIERPHPALVVAIVAAGLLALVPLVGILPKAIAEGVALSAPIFDHSKIALIDEIARSGVPATNPFFNEIGAPERVSYYYLWHFSAAIFAVMFGISGWEADAALTGFTAFASLLVMIGLSIQFSARAWTGVPTVALAATDSLRLPLRWLLGEDLANSLFGKATGFGSWIFQVSWAPQHIASATCAVLACMMIPRLATRRDVVTPIILALVFAAGFESSIWVGGVLFPVAAICIAVAMVFILGHEEIAGFIGRGVAAAVIGLMVAAPLIRDQLAAAAVRELGWPLVIRPVSVLGEAFPSVLARILDLPAYWLIYLPIEFPAFFPVGMLGLYWCLRQSAPSPQQKVTVYAFEVLAAVSLTASWLVASNVGDNNDFGWRTVLPAVMLLIPFSAVLFSHWLSIGALRPLALMSVPILLGMISGADIIRGNMVGNPNASASAFAGTPIMWEAVRRHSRSDERVANNPRDLSLMTPWAANIGWALLANRRSCYAGDALALPFAVIPSARRKEIDAQFSRVFDGKVAGGDVEQLHRRFTCDLVVLTPRDGAWNQDPFATGGNYKLVESRAGQWRIYRRDPMPR